MRLAKPSRARAEAHAPASVGNVAVGFDVLGFAAGIAGDRVLLEALDSREVEIVSVSAEPGALIHGDTLASIPLDPSKNTATAGLIRMIEEQSLGFGFRASIVKGIPFGSGMGGSAASAVASVVAANAMLATPLPREKLLEYALVGEEQASGSAHPDNIAPCLVGGLTFARARGGQSGVLRELDLFEIPIPPGLFSVLVHPRLELETKTARSVLRKEVPLKSFVEQSANLSAFLIGCFRGDVDALSKSLADVLIEPQRAHLIPGFDGVKAAALANGALGASISGAGPSVFGWFRDFSAAQAGRSAMIRAFRDAGLEAEGWAFALPQPGARVVS
jgi:homoserine kinase